MVLLFLLCLPKSLYFQAYNRKADIVIGRTPFYDFISNRVDYLGTGYLGTMEIYPFSANMKEIQNYLMNIQPFDKYIWIFLGISVLSVTLAVVTIDLCFASWERLPTKDIVYQSKVAYQVILSDLRKQWFL